MRAGELISKEVINIRDGCKIGCVYDFDFDECSGEIKAIIVISRGRFFGFFGGGEEFIVLWEQIVKLSCDVVLVELERRIPTKKHNFKRN